MLTYYAYIFNYFLYFRDELLKALLPIRTFFPSLVKTFFSESPLPNPPTEADDEQEPQTPEATPPETYCPFCRQPYQELEGQPVSDFLAAAAAANAAANQDSVAEQNCR